MRPHHASYLPAAASIMILLQPVRANATPWWQANYGTEGYSNWRMLQCGGSPTVGSATAGVCPCTDCYYLGPDT